MIKSLIGLFVFMLQLSVVAQNCGFTIEETVTQPTCSGFCDGAATLAVSGGTSPYTYAWVQSGVTANSDANLCEGIFEVVITDNASCDSSYFVEVIPSEIVELEIITKSDLNCGIGGIIEATATGGTFNFEYHLTGDDTSGKSNFEELEAGAYILTVYDDNGCSDSVHITLVDLGCVEPTPEEAFTPNGDGMNDTWRIPNLELYPKSILYVYDRWGQQVHSQEGYLTEWNGDRKGSRSVPDATYYYIIYKDKEDTSKGVIKGSVAVVR